MNSPNARKYLFFVVEKCGSPTHTSHHRINQILLEPRNHYVRIQREIRATVHSAQCMEDNFLAADFPDSQDFAQAEIQLLTRKISAGDQTGKLNNSHSYSGLAFFDEGIRCINQHCHDDTHMRKIQI